LLPPARFEELSTLDWLREALEVSPDAFAVHHLVRDDAGCFRALEAADPGSNEEPRLAARVLAARLLDTIGQGAAIIGGDDLRVQAANEAFSRVMTNGADRALGRPVTSLFSNEGARVRAEAWLAELTSGDSRLDSLRLQVTETRVLALEALRIHQTRYVLLLARDASTPTLAPVDPALRAELLGTIDAVAMVDQRGVFTFASPGLHHLFGYEAGELTGQLVEILIPEARRGHHVEARNKTFGSGERALQGEGFLARRKDGSQVPIGISLSRLTVGERQLMLCFVTDLDRRRAATERLRDYQEHLRRMSYDLAVAAEQERRKVAVELHDCLGQALVLAKLKLTAIGDAVPHGARDTLAEVVRIIDQCSTDTRTLTFQLSPPVLHDQGLAAAIDWLRDDLQLRYGLKVELVDEASPFVLDETTATVTFRAIRELLLNVLKHANSPRAQVTLRRRERVLSISVADDGVGFEPNLVGGMATRRFGLSSVRDQLHRLGGRLEVRSSIGRGSFLELQVPLAHDRAPTSSPATR
jgi:PAS domain S-box-containing protein